VQIWSIFGKIKQCKFYKTGFMTFSNGPDTFPLLQTLEVIVNPLESLKNNFRHYGDAYTAQFGGYGSVVVLAQPEAIEAVMTAPANLFKSGASNAVFESFFGSRSILMLDGKAHQRARKLLTPPFHGERLKAYGEDICDITSQAIANWQSGTLFSARQVAQDISLRVIVRTVFGVHEGKRAEPLWHHLDKLLSFFDEPLNSILFLMPSLQIDLGPWSPWGKFVQQLKVIDALLLAEIKERRAYPELLGDDILSLMMAARDEEGQPMSEQELRDEMMTLLFAGHETTATAIAWALYWIHYVPEVGNKLQKELQEIENTDDPVTIARLPYLSAICSETLRIYPVALFTFFRVLQENWTLMGQDLEAGTQLAPCIYLLHHRSDLYPDPDRFRPERFLERQFSPYEYIPFGGGNRRCLGMAFALFEMKLVLTTILNRWQLKLYGDRPIKPVRRGATMAPAQGVPMQVIKRL
jgi:cytochrome P450 family 110